MLLNHTGLMFGKFWGIKSTNYDNFKFINTRYLFKLSLEYPPLSGKVFLTRSF